MCQVLSGEPPKKKTAPHMFIWMSKEPQDIGVLLELRIYLTATL